MLEIFGMSWNKTDSYYVPSHPLPWMQVNMKGTQLAGFHAPLRSLKLNWYGIVINKNALHIERKWTFVSGDTVPENS